MTLVYTLQFKMWLKPSAEQSFLYGNHVSKSGLGRITENISQYQGVVFYSMSDIPVVRTNIGKIVSDARISTCPSRMNRFYLYFKLTREENMVKAPICVGIVQEIGSDTVPY